MNAAAPTLQAVARCEACRTVTTLPALVVIDAPCPHCKRRKTLQTLRTFVEPEAGDEA